MPDLRAALRTIHADREWWRKILVGGAISLTFVGWPCVEGHQLESIENSQRGFPTPLPRWSDLGTKGLVGFFAIIIDFFFFVLPILSGAMFLFCGTIAIELTGTSPSGYVVSRTIIFLTVIYVFAIWLSGASAVAKQRYVSGADFSNILSGSLVRELLRAPARGFYLRARLLSTPAYLLTLGLFSLALFLLRRNFLAGLLVGWLALSGLVYARLVAIQLYLAATRALERQQFDAVRSNGKRRVET